MEKLTPGKRSYRDTTMALIQKLASLSSAVRVPTVSDKIYKDECVFSFDTPESENGLYICLYTFIGLGKEHVERYFNHTGYSVYLHIKRIRREIPSEGVSDTSEQKITRLAIGVAGGFNPDLGKKKFEFEEKHEIILMPNFESIELPNADIPEFVNASIQAILESDSAARRAELESLSAGSWDGEARVVSKYAANLHQISNGKKIPPSGWKCEKCDLTQNLWLNLTDGSILCGRKFYDGSGGNNHAVEHFLETHYPLAVKLGTITKDGKADVFSYQEDDMVLDPFLADHMGHWGINISEMEKTDKSMVELELDLNQRFGEWSVLQEAGSKLVPLYGPAYTGLVNLGNSCYLNSVMQVIFSIPDFVDRFVRDYDKVFSSAPSDPAMDFNVQMAKLGLGLLSGKYSKRPPEDDNGKPVITEEETQPGISPLMFKNLISKGHPEFSTKRQQDAQEFFMHFINTVERHSRNQKNPADCFKFSVEDRFECNESHKVKYTYRSEYSLPLSIPLEAAVNENEVKEFEAKKEDLKSQGLPLDSLEVVRPRIKLSACLQAFAKPEVIQGFYSTAVNKKTTAQKTTRLASFPDYLLIHLKKFTIRSDWVPIKLDVAVDMPDIIDLGTLRGTGPQADEELLPEALEEPKITVNQEMLQQLVAMGFPPEPVKKALYFTDNKSIVEAESWLMHHLQDADFLEEFVPPGAGRPGKDGSEFVPNEASLEMIMSMGFTKQQATKALKATDGNIERAADWIFSHLAELEEEAMEEQGSCGREAETAPPQFRDGGNLYQLVAFISHMGTSSMVGHYVCHIFREGHWVIYNDNKVSLSEHPPKDLGYLYLYKHL